jgi:predicted anti-sigma-YlaC factor YlaD
VNALSETDCARARESVSAELDGELPELELQWQRAHLRICPDCSAWAECVQKATTELRDARLEQPVLGFAQPQRARRWAVSPALAVASAAAVAASVVVALGQQRAPANQGTGGSEPATHAASTTTPLAVEERRLSLDSLSITASAPVPRYGMFRAV